MFPTRDDYWKAAAKITEDPLTQGRIVNIAIVLYGMTMSGENSRTSLNKAIRVAAQTVNQFKRMV